MIKESKWIYFSCHRNERMVCTQFRAQPFIIDYLAIINCCLHWSLWFAYGLGVAEAGYLRYFICRTPWFSVLLSARKPIVDRAFGYDVAIQSLNNHFGFVDDIDHAVLTIEHLNIGANYWIIVLVINEQCMEAMFSKMHLQKRTKYEQNSPTLTDTSLPLNQSCRLAQERWCRLEKGGLRWR